MAKKKDSQNKKKVVATDQQSIKEEKKLFEHSFKDKSLRFPIDALLRENNFEVWERKPKKEPRWKKNRELYTQKEALSTFDIDKVEDAIYLDFLYYQYLW